MPSRIHHACTIDGCGGKHKGHGLCDKHLQRFRKYGDPNHTEKTPPGAPLKWLSSMGPSDECITWPFCRNTSGYAHVWAYGRMVIVSRLVCEQANGKPPSPKHEARHSCGKGHEACVNPKHISWSTHVENIQDRRLHGTENIGMRNWKAKLTDEDVLVIRGATERPSELASRYGVSDSCISNVRSRRRWRHV